MLLIFKMSWSSSWDSECWVRWAGPVSRARRVSLEASLSGVLCGYVCLYGLDVRGFGSCFL